MCFLNALRAGRHPRGSLAKFQMIDWFSPGINVDPALVNDQKTKLVKIADRKLDRKSVEELVKGLADKTAEVLLDIIKDDMEARELRTLNELNIFLKDDKPEVDWDERARVWRVISKSLDSVKAQVIASVTHYDVYGLTQSVLDHFDMQSQGKIEGRPFAPPLHPGIRPMRQQNLHRPQVATLQGQLQRVPATGMLVGG